MARMFQTTLDPTLILFYLLLDPCVLGRCQGPRTPPGAHLPLPTELPYPYPQPWPGALCESCGQGEIRQ